MSNPNGGRLVWNHSTHIQGLIPVLERLLGYTGIQTITPAVLGRAKSHCPKLQLKVSVPIRGDLKSLPEWAKPFKKYLYSPT
jgi:hypothetical protein